MLVLSSEVFKTLTDGSFGAVHGSWTSKFGLGPPDACIECFGTALVHNCGEKAEGSDVNLVLNLRLASDVA